MLPQFLRSCNLPSSVRLTAEHLWSRVNRKRYLAKGDTFVWPSRGTLAAELGITLRTLRRHLSELAEGGWLRKAARKVEGWLRRGWELLNPSAEQSEAAEDVRDSGHGCPLSEGPISITEPELNHHTPRACARQEESELAVGGGLGEDTLHRDTPDSGRASTTAAAPEATPSKHVAGPGPGPAQLRAPRSPDEVRADALWHAYESRRARELGGKPHRGQPRYRDLAHIVELVDHAQRTRTEGDREAAWHAVTAYGDGAIRIVDWFRESKGHDDRVWWRADGWEWSPDRFDRVMRDVDRDVTGERAERVRARWQAEQDAYRAERDARPSVTSEQLAELVEQFLPGGAVDGLAPAL